ncbi:hypothetical protein GQ54DRAFT_198068 [Martensiomyces pterosporus]|nr:hypothetical protein GQ54DRAFT_198068 [Martensiomyces pterosporus]
MKKMRKDADLLRKAEETTISSGETLDLCLGGSRRSVGGIADGVVSVVGAGGDSGAANTRDAGDAWGDAVGPWQHMVLLAGGPPYEGEQIEREQNKDWDRKAQESLEDPAAVTVASAALGPQGTAQKASILALTHAKHAGSLKSLTRSARGSQRVPIEGESEVIVHDAVGADRGGGGGGGVLVGAVELVQLGGNPDPGCQPQPSQDDLPHALAAGAAVPAQTQHLAQDEEGNGDDGEAGDNCSEDGRRTGLPVPVSCGEAAENQGYNGQGPGQPEHSGAEDGSKF